MGLTSVLGGGRMGRRKEKSGRGRRGNKQEEREEGKKDGGLDRCFPMSSRGSKF